MYYFESANPESNIQAYWDGEWSVFAIITTIGWGDFYPSTFEGRILTKVIFICGAVTIGLIIGVASKATGADKSVPNRELRTVLAEVLRKLEHYEKVNGICIKVDKDSHNLDHIFEQVEYSSNRLRDGYLTTGKDSSGMYILAVDAYDKETGQEIHRWIPGNSMQELNVMLKRFLEREDEL